MKILSNNLGCEMQSNNNYIVEDIVHTLMKIRDICDR